MKGKLFFIILLCLGVFGAMQLTALSTQKIPKTLTLLYSNNFNGEIEPCPT